jgi:hypothetical protein
VGGEVVLGADRGGRIDEAERLAAGVVDRPGVGRDVEFSGPQRRSLLAIDVAGHDHQAAALGTG